MVNTIPILPYCRALISYRRCLCRRDVSHCQYVKVLSSKFWAGSQIFRVLPNSQPPSGSLSSSRIHNEYGAPNLVRRDSSILSLGLGGQQAQSTKENQDGGFPIMAELVPEHGWNFFATQSCRLLPFIFIELLRKTGERGKDSCMGNGPPLRIANAMKNGVPCAFVTL